MGDQKNMTEKVLDFVGLYYDGAGWREAKYVMDKVTALPYTKIKEMYELSLSYFKLELKIDEIASGFEEWESESESN